MHKVVVGSFKTKENAEERITFLRSKKIEAFIRTAVVSSETWYRVQAGAFSNKENAIERLDEVKKAGIPDAYILSENTNSVPNMAKSSVSSILGPTFLTPEQMNRFVKEVNRAAIELGEFYSTFGKYYGIRGDIAFAQAMLETDYLRFTGVVNPEQNNFCGLGTTGPRNPGASFSTPREGVLAHLQHLFAYASTNPLPNQYPFVDPRFNLVKRGSATTWVGLNGKWAVPGTHYGQTILNIYEKMVHEARNDLDKS